MPFEEKIIENESVLVFSNDYWMGEIVVSNNANIIKLKHVPTGLDLFRSPESMAELRKYPERFGMPFLFLPGRIADGKFTFNGQNYFLPVNEPEMNNCLHGMILADAWELAGVNETSDALTIVLQYAYTETHETFSGFPHRFSLKLEYVFEKDQLKVILILVNESKDEMPFGVGFHTAFNITDDDVVLITHEDRRWEMIAERKLPTGNKLKLNENEIFSMPNGRRIGGSAVGMICCAVPQLVNDKMLSGAIIDYAEFPAKLRYDIGEQYPFIAAWNDGGGKGFLCIEPWTSISNAVNLQIPREQSGMNSLLPDQAWEGTSTLSITQ